VTAHAHELDLEQRRAWEQEIGILKTALRELTGIIYLEFDVPRLGSRIDAVLISGPAIFPIEFKCGEREYHKADYNQAWDYALDLKNFHLASHHAPVLPVLVATAASRSDDNWGEPHPDGVRPPRRCRVADVERVFVQGLAPSMVLRWMVKRGAGHRTIRRRPLSKPLARFTPDTRSKQFRAVTRVRRTCARHQAQWKKSSTGRERTEKRPSSF
jgi:hypothetical protein